jgi:uncharacterized protein (DUF362 family)
MTRRRFTALAAGTLASLGLPAGRAQSAASRAPASLAGLAYADRSPVPVALAGVAHGAAEDATERAVREAAEAATDFSWLSGRDTVLIKPVCNSGNAYPATTDPIALATMIRMLREKGARRVVVADMSGVQVVRFRPDGLSGSTRELMHQSGMAQAAEAAGGEIHAFEEAGWEAFFEDAPEASASWSRPLQLPRILAEVDHVVLMPRCARHVLAGTTLGLKAGVGWWRHDTRLEYHRDAATLAEKTAEAATAPALRSRQRLVLTSATRVMSTFGPDEGWVAEPETGLVMASPSVVAHDMVSFAWLLENRRETPAEARDGMFEDPATSSLMAEVANRFVTRWLGGLGAALGAESLGHNDVDGLWTDRVLRRAFEIEGGVPRVELIAPDGSVPETLRQRLAASVDPAAS